MSLHQLTVKRHLKLTLAWWFVCHRLPGTAKHSLWRRFFDRLARKERN